MGLGTVNAYLVEDAKSETREVVRKHRKGCSNEVLAAIAFEAFCDACPDGVSPREPFIETFPTLAIYI
jgi:hypothetical protein